MFDAAASLTDERKSYADFWRRQGPLTKKNADGTTAVTAAVPNLQYLVGRRRRAGDQG
jgi:hypothetical protein